MNLTSQPELRPGLRLHAAAPVLASCPRRPVDKALVHAVVVALQVEDLQERDSIGLKNRPKISPKNKNHPAVKDRMVFGTVFK